MQQELNKHNIQRNLFQNSPVYNMYQFDYIVKNQSV